MAQDDVTTYTANVIVSSQNEKNYEVTLRSHEVNKPIPTGVGRQLPEFFSSTAINLKPLKILT